MMMLFGNLIGLAAGKNGMLQGALKPTIRV